MRFSNTFKTYLWLEEQKFLWRGKINANPELEDQEPNYEAELEECAGVFWESLSYDEKKFLIERPGNTPEERIAFYKGKDGNEDY